MEELVLLILRAVRALQAADKEHRYSHRNQHGKDASILRDPMCQGLHVQSPFPGSFDPEMANQVAHQCNLVFHIDGIDT